MRTAMEAEAAGSSSKCATDDEYAAPRPTPTRKPAKHERVVPPKPRPRRKLTKTPVRPAATAGAGSANDQGKGNTGDVPVPSTTPAANPTTKKERKKPKRNDEKAEDDKYKREYAKTTIPIGPIADVVIQPSTEETKATPFLAYWQGAMAATRNYENELRIHVNLKLRRLFADPAVTGDSLTEIAKAVDPSSKASTLRDLIRLLVKDFQASEIAEREYRNLGISLERDNVIQLLVGNLKTLAVMNVKRVLAIDVRRKIEAEHPAIHGKFARDVARLTAAMVLGRDGRTTRYTKEEDDEDDEDDAAEETDEDDAADKDDEDGAALADDAGSTKGLTMTRYWELLGRYLGRARGTTAADAAFLAGLKAASPTIAALRAKFLPATLAPFVDEWKQKVSAEKYANMGRVWRFFADVNMGGFVQHLFPTPSVAGRFWQVTTTRLAIVWTRYLQSLDQNGRLEAKCLLDEETLVRLGHPLDKLPRTPAAWTPHPVALWNLVFPGISAFVDERAARGNKVKFLHYAQADAYTIRCFFAKLKCPWKTEDGKPARSWRSRVDSHGKVDLAALAGRRLRHLPHLGPGSVRGFRGMINIDCALREGSLHTGSAQAADLFNNRLVVLIDPGQANLAGIVYACGTLDPVTSTFAGNFKKGVIRSSGYRQAAGIDAYCASTDVAMDAHKPGMLRLSQQHGRTMDLAEYQDHADTFKQAGPALVQHSNSAAQRRQYASLQRQKQAYWSGVVNRIYAVNDVIGADPSKPPIIVFGNGSFSTARGSTSGNYSWLKRYLARFFLVVLVDEYNTSQKCPKCHGQLQFHGAGVRIKKCDSCSPNGRPGMPFLVNRDISAAMNFAAVTCSIVARGTRPVQFTPAANKNSRCKNSAPLSECDLLVVHMCACTDPHE